MLVVYQIQVFNGICLSINQKKKDTKSSSLLSPLHFVKMFLFCFTTKNNQGKEDDGIKMNEEIERDPEI